MKNQKTAQYTHFTLPTGVCASTMWTNCSSNIIITTITILWLSVPSIFGLIDASSTMQRSTHRSWGELEKVPTSTTSSFKVFRLFVKDDGTFPNNADYPLLLYKSAFTGNRFEGEQAIAAEGKWTSPWAWGIFPYHHYHSKAWELLLCVEGQANVQVGGDKGPKVLIAQGDLVLVPPGLAHKQLDATKGFTLLGSYPKSGYSGIDTLTGAPTADERHAIQTCPVPPSDPVFGLDILELCRQLI